MSFLSGDCFIERRVPMRWTRLNRYFSCPEASIGTLRFCQVLSDWRMRDLNKAGWVARTRPLAEPLSPRGPQPVPRRLRMSMKGLNGSAEPLDRVPG